MTMTSIIKAKSIRKSENVVHSDSDSEDMLDGVDSENRLVDQDFPISDDEYATDSSDMSDDDEDAEKEGESMSGFAASMAKVLKAKEPTTEKTLILSKAIKDEDKKKKLDKGFGFEIDGEAKEDTSINETTKHELFKKKITERRRKYKRMLDLRVKPSFTDIEREKTFKKIATKGVVQLFNAVRAQQKDITNKIQSAGKLESKREKALQNVSHKAFLNALMSGKRAQSELIDNPVKAEDVKDESDSGDDDDDGNYKNKTWGPLRNDFFTSKNSGWDKMDDDDEEAENESELNSDTD